MSNGKFALVLALLISVGVAAWPSNTQKSVGQGVTLSVTPGNLDPDNGIWDFAVSLHSEGPRLTDELMDSVVPVGDGHRMKPLAEGEKSGGRHRAGA